MKKWSMELKIGLLLAPVYGLEAWYVVRASVDRGFLLLGISLGLFVVACTVWNLDVHKLFWPKRAGHGVWRILAAPAFALLFWVAAG